MQNGRGWADRRLSMVGRGGGLAPPPLENEKKAVRGNFNLFRLCFTNEIKGGLIHYTYKMEGGGRTGACPWWEGVGRARGAKAPLENEKRKGEYRPISLCGGG